MRILRKIWNYIANNPTGQLMVLAVILAAAGYFYFYRLGADYITLWDEAVHVNVVKNLANDCCAPKLHLTDIGIDFQDWTSNYIWVHKPLAPLFLQAAVYKIGGGSLFAFRLPSALFALLSIAALFFTARRHFGFSIALASSSLFAFNPYVFELVKGRQFSGLHDLMFGFFGILALNQVLNIVRTPAVQVKGSLAPTLRSGRGMTERSFYLLFGLFVGLGYLSKGGLVLLFFPAIFVATIISKDKRESILNFLWACLVAFIIIFPEKVILLLLYPAEYYFEQRVQVLHLFKDLEYWGRPWDYYLTVYFRDLFLPYLYLPALAGVFYGLYRFRVDKRLMVLTSWVLSFLLPLSFGVTKISNFVFAAAPAILLLCVLSFLWLWQKQHHIWMFALSATAILSYLIIRLDVGQAKHYLFGEQTYFQRFAVLFFEILLFAGVWILCKIFEKSRNVPFLAKGLAITALFLVLGVYARANQLADQKSREDYGEQMKLKRAAAELKENYPSDAIFLLFYPKLPKSHLYFKYWSGFDALEIYDRQPIFVLRTILPKNRPIFVLAEEPIVKADLKIIRLGDYGAVYGFGL